eukprot:2968894-Prorocentrum_lima.AAC.1
MHCGPGTPPMVVNPTMPTPWSPVQNDTTTHVLDPHRDEDAQHAEITISPTQAFQRQRAAHET